MEIYIERENNGKPNNTEFFIIIDLIVDMLSLIYNKIIMIINFYENNINFIRSS